VVRLLSLVSLVDILELLESQQFAIQVGKGLIDEYQLDDIHHHMATLLKEEDDDASIDKIYACMTTKEENDPNMKPNPGMILQACRDFNVSPEDCLFVGDTFLIYKLLRRLACH